MPNPAKWDATGDLRILADSWDGPHFRPFMCGINDFRVTPPPHAMFMDAIEPLGTWEYVLSGAIYYSVSNERYRVEAGEALVSRRPDPGWMLRPVKDVPVRTLWVEVTGEPALRMFDYLHLTFGQIQVLPIDSPVIKLAAQLVKLVAAKPNRPAYFWSAKAFEWMNAWWQTAKEHHKKISHSQLHAMKPSRLISYTPKTVKNFAAEVGYSRSHLTRKLTQQWKRSPGRVLREVRLQDAARLLRTTRMSVNEVAVKVGYVSTAGFCRAFLRQYEVSPGRYRRKET